MKNIRFTEELSELEHIEWSFYLLDFTLWLDEYIVYRRENKKQRKYKTVEKYARVMGRDNTIKLENISLTEDIKAKVLNMFVENLTVKKWDR